MYKTLYMHKPLSKCEPGTKVTTGQKIITPGDIDIFCDMTKNDLPMFLVEEEAKAYGWRTRLVPGVYTLSCSVGLMESAGLLSDVMAYMAVDELRFIAPVYPGDVLHVEVELLSKRLTKAGDRGLVNYQWATYNQEGKAVLQAKNTCMFKVPAEGQETKTDNIEEMMEAKGK